MAIRAVLDRARIREQKQVELITMEMIDAEIARLEGEIETAGGTRPHYSCGCPDCQPG